jgi:hypothetical protein
MSAKNACEHAAELGSRGGGLGRGGDMTAFMLVPEPACSCRPTT